MFAKKFSIPKSEFTKIKKNPILFHSSTFSVLLRIREDLGNPRFAVVISNKVSKLSTHRNRIRRAVRDALRRNWKKVNNDLDMVFLIKPGVEKKPVTDIMKEIEVFLNKKEYETKISKFK